MNDVSRWRGVVALVCDGVEHGSRAIERLQIETARRTFTILEHIPPIAAPTRLVHSAYDASVNAVHGTIRGVSAVVGKAVDVALALGDERVRRD